MVPLRIVLIAVLLLPLAATAQTEELSPPPLPSETEVPSPPTAAPESTADVPVDAPRTSTEAMAPPSPALDTEERTSATATTADPPRSLRITSEVVGGVLGAAAGGLVGYLGGVALFCAGNFGGGYCSVFGIVTAVPIAWVGLGLGTWVGGNLTGGKGVWLAPMLGSAAGVVGAWLGGAVIGGLVNQSTPLAIVLGVLVGSLPVVGAVVGYELSHGAELQRALAPTAIAPLLTPELKGVALAWAF